MTDEQVAKLSVAQLKTLTVDVTNDVGGGIKGISATHVGNDNMRTLSGLPSGHIQALSVDPTTGAIPAITPKQMGKFSAVELGYFTPVMANSLSDDVVDWAVGTKRYAVVESATGLNSDVAGTTAVAGIQTNIANVQGTTAADKITTGTTNDTITGNGGADSIDSGAGNDSISISSTSTVDGGDGNDTLTITASVTLTDADLTNVEAITVTLAATGTVDLSAQTEALIITGTGAQSATITGGSAADSITGTTGADSITGNSGADTITSNGGADTITGDTGNDAITLTDLATGNLSINGGAGNDTVTILSSTGSTNSDTIKGGADTDILKLVASAAFTTSFLVDGFETIKVGDTDTAASLTQTYTLDFYGVDFAGDGAGVYGAVAIDASALTTGHLVTNLSTSTTPTDPASITGGAGADTIFGGSGADTISGGQGADVIGGGSGGADSITGGAGNDTIDGGNGADTIDGGAGNDSIALGTTDGAADKVVFAATAALNGSDTITQFEAGTDDIDLSAFGSASSLTQWTWNTTITPTEGAVYFWTDNSNAGWGATLNVAWFLSQQVTVVPSTVTAFIVIVDQTRGNSAIYQWVDAGNNEIVDSELTLMGTVDAVLTSADIIFSAGNSSAAIGGGGADSTAPTVSAYGATATTVTTTLTSDTGVIGLYTTSGGTTLATGVTAGTITATTTGSVTAVAQNAVTTTYYSVKAKLSG